MNSISYIAVNVFETLLRVVPFFRRTGIIRIGNPNRNSPVFITCNYHLTVERVKRALRDLDAYLLVANSRGINVWCASAGGYFTNHSVISILKVSGIEKLVDHRDVVLPQLAATGIETKIIQKKTGWKVIWGPVYAKDIPLFIKNDFKKTAKMREVKFPWAQRIEMGAAWAFPISLVFTIIMSLFWRKALLPLNLLIWSLSFLIFLLFPLYSKRLKPEKRGAGLSKYTVFFDFNYPLIILWIFFILCLAAYGILTGSFAWEPAIRWGLISFMVILMLSLDLLGSTPVYKSRLHADVLMSVILDEKKCRGVGFCEQVCPRNCFQVDKKSHSALMPRAEKCVQCGACIVQCPFDALYFANQNGGVILPATIRKFKVNLIGKRLVKV